MQTKTGFTERNGKAEYFDTTTKSWIYVADYPGQVLESNKTTESDMTRICQSKNESFRMTHHNEHTVETGCKIAKYKKVLNL